MVYGYIRVSSDKQTVENQRFEIIKFCQKEKLTINGWIEETISGTKNYDKRKLGRLLKKVTKGALARKKAEGIKLGRPLGKAKKVKLTGKEETIKKLLKEKISKSEIARKLKVDRGTLSKFIKNYIEK